MPQSHNPQAWRRLEAYSTSSRRAATIKGAGLHFSIQPSHDILPLMRALLCLLLFSSALTAEDGAALFEKHCAVCHRTGSEVRAPLAEALSQMSRQAIMTSLETGSMKIQGAELNAAERAAVAAFLSTKNVSPATQPRSGFCASNEGKLDASAAQWNGWGVDLANSRFQPLTSAALKAEQVPALKLKWAFGFPNATSVFGQPTIAGGRLFLGSGDGTVYSLDAYSGCIYWTFKASSTVRTAVSIDPALKSIYFGDVQANVYRLGAASGELLWKVHVEQHPLARITGAPKLYAGRLYVPVSSGVEEMAAANPKYPCCTFRGSVVALDAETGKQLWKTYTIPDPAKPTRVNQTGTQLMGPAGAAVWSSPTIDVERKAVYVATGNSYADPPVGYNDAILSFDLETGSMQWARQITAHDTWNAACLSPNKASCPENPGEDLDFGSSPILVKLSGGHRLLLAGQKAGVMHALDPDQQGKIVWQVRLGKGGLLGGIEWGSAADGQAVYAAISDLDFANPAAGGGLFALQIATGEKIWQAPPPKPTCLVRAGCSAAQQAPVTVIPGVVFSGSMDGHLRAYQTSGGKLVWDFDVLRDFETVNGVPARGGSLNATGPTVAGGMLFLGAGYSQIVGLPGNVLLAFAAE